MPLGITPLVWALCFGYWGKHWARGLLVLASLAMGVAAWCATRSLNRGAHQAEQQAVAPLGGQADLCVSNDDSGVPSAWADQFRAVSGVRQVRPLILRNARVVKPRSLSAQILGVDFASATESKVVLSPNAIDEMAVVRFTRQTPVLVGRGLVDDLGATVGPIEMLVDGHTLRPTIAGTIEDAPGPLAVLTGHVLVMSVGDLATLLGRPDRVTRLDVMLTPDADAHNVRRQLAAITHGAAQVRSSELLEQRSGDMFAGVSAAFSLCGIGALVAGLLLIHNVLAVGVAERRHDAGMLRSLGATRGQILATFLAEAAVLGLVGGLIGGPIGFGFSRIGAGPISNILSDVFMPLGPIQTKYTLSDGAEGVLVGLLTAVIAAALPSMSAAAVSPIAALRRLPDQPERIIAWRSWLPAVTFLAFGLILNRYGKAWLALFALTIAALAAAIPLTQLIARFVRPLARQLTGFGTSLAIDNLLRWPKRYGLATATLAGGTALLVQTAGIIRSNESAVTDWIDHSVVGDLFVTSGGPLSASGTALPMKKSTIDAWTEPGMHITAFRFRHIDWRQDGRSARLLLVLLDAKSYRDTVADRFPELPNRELFRRLSEESGTAVVSQNFSALHGLGSGDTLTLPVAGGVRDFRILGTVSDYSCTQGTVLLDRGRDGEGLSDGLVDNFTVTLPANADVEAVRAKWLRSPQAAANALTILTHDELRSHTLGMIRRLYGVAAAQLAIVDLVSVLGVAAAMTISVIQRRGELGLLRSMGATRRQVMGVMMNEAVGLGALATAVGLLLGFGLEWMTLRWALLSETGFVFPPRIPEWGTLIVALASLAGAAAAGIFPALSAARMSPAVTVVAE